MSVVSEFLETENMCPDKARNFLTLVNKQTNVPMPNKCKLTCNVSTSVSETVERNEAWGPPLFNAGPVVIEPPDGDTVPPEP